MWWHSTGLAALIALLAISSPDRGFAESPDGTVLFRVTGEYTESTAMIRVAPMSFAAAVAGTTYSSGLNRSAFVCRTSMRARVPR